MTALPTSISERTNPIVPPSQEATLRRLFLTLFLRGRSSRGHRKGSAPNSIGQKLALTLFFYVMMGGLAFAFVGKPIFALSVYLHAMTFVFLGMFVAASAGEILFNKEEADILLHRPITTRALLWAKTRVLVEVSLWLAGAFNLIGFFVGSMSPSGTWLFLPVHIVSTVLEALFCTSAVIMVYQLCLRWFGRERLDGLMTTAQVFVSIAAVAGGQLLPHMASGANLLITPSTQNWWIMLVPPAWFAGFDDALAGSFARSSWILAAAAVVATASVMLLAFGKLSADYQTGLQGLNDAAPARKTSHARRRWLDRLATVPPLSWWLRDAVSRASFLLCTAYLLRDRDMKLRFYPGIAPMLIMPAVMLLQQYSRHQAPSAFNFAFMGAFIGILPMLGLITLQCSQQWQAADIFRAAPMAGPSALCAGARRAIFLVLTLPVVVLFGLIAWLLQGSSAGPLLLLPGILAVPVFSILPNMRGGAVPLSSPTEEAKSARRGTVLVGASLLSFLVAGISAAAWSMGWFGWFILAEALVVGIVYTMLRVSISRSGWSSIE